MKKVLILVVSSKTYPSYINQIFQKVSWAKNSKYPVLFYFGGSKKINIKKNNLYLTSSTKFEDMGKKTLEAFDYVNQNYDFDFILRTNNSSYIDYELEIEELHHWLQNQKMFDNLKDNNLLKNIKLKIFYMETMSCILNGNLRKAIKNILFFPLSLKKIRLAIAILMPKKLLKKIKNIN